MPTHFDGLQCVWKGRRNKEREKILKNNRELRANQNTTNEREKQREGEEKEVTTFLHRGLKKNERRKQRRRDLLTYGAPYGRGV